MSRKVSLRLFIALVVHRSDGLLQGDNRFNEGLLELRQVFYRGNDVLVDHVNHAHCLDLHGAHIVCEHDGLTGGALFGR